MHAYRHARAHTHTHTHTQNTHTSHALSHPGRGQWRMENPAGSTFGFLKVLSPYSLPSVHSLPCSITINEYGHRALDFVAFKNIFGGITKLTSHSQ